MQDIKELTKKFGILEQLLKTLPKSQHEEFLKIAEGIIQEQQEIYNEIVMEMQNGQKESKSKQQDDASVRR